MDSIRQTLVAKTAAWNNVINHEASQPPLYYALAGAWWRLGKVFGFHDGLLLYWFRFLNIFFVVALVGLGYVAARLVFPERRFLRLGVPALLAFFPQTAFYSIQNDVLSPLCFGAAFICLVKWLRADAPGVRLGTATGLALAATYLTKISNLPLLAVSGAVVLFKISRLAKAGKLRAAFPALAALALCAGLPMAAGWRGPNAISAISPARRRKFSFSTGRTNRSANGGSIRFSRRTVYGLFYPPCWRRSGRGNFYGIASRWPRRS